MDNDQHRLSDENADTRWTGIIFSLNNSGRSRSELYIVPEFEFDFSGMPVLIQNHLMIFLKFSLKELSLYRVKKSKWGFTSF